jgi:glycosyltransferase involved in cell wall biosynthesis
MSWRGGQSQVHLLLQEQIKQGMDCRLAARPGSALALKTEGLCPRLLLKMRNEADLLAAFKLGLYCRREKMDILHTHDARSHGLSLWAKLLNPGLRIVLHRRVELLPAGNIYNRIKYSSRNVAACIAVSERVRQAMQGFLPDNKISVIPDAAARPAFLSAGQKQELKTELCRSLNADPGLPLILAAGHLSPEKGHRSLIEALHLMKQQGQSFTVAIAGQGPCQKELQGRIEELGLENSVFLPGFREDVLNLLQISDVYVMPSISEGLGSGILEAMACGCPVAASRAGGIPEIVRDEMTGLLFEPGHPAQMSEKIRRLLGDRKAADRIGLNGQRYVRDNFDPSALAQKITGIYHQTLEKQ